MKKIILAAFMFAALTNSAFATHTETDWGRVLNVNLTSTGSVTFSTSAPRINPFGCPFSAYLIPKAGNDNFPEYFTLLLAAKGFGSEVRFRIDNDSCEGPHPKIIFFETRDAQ